MELVITPRSICQTQFLRRVYKLRKKKKIVALCLKSSMKREIGRGRGRAVTARGMHQNCAARPKLLLLWQGEFICSIHV